MSDKKIIGAGQEKLTPLSLLCADVCAYLQFFVYPYLKFEVLWSVYNMKMSRIDFSFPSSPSGVGISLAIAITGVLSV